MNGNPHEHVKQTKSNVVSLVQRMTKGLDMWEVYKGQRAGPGGLKGERRQREAGLVPEVHDAPLRTAT